MIEPSAPQTAPREEARRDAEPYFLCGAVRSGTTLLRLLLGHHPALTRCEEFEFVAPALFEAGAGMWPDVARYREALPQRLDVQLAELPEIPDSSSFPDLARQLLRLHARADGRRIYGATVHDHFDLLTRVWPEAKFLYLRRDPRDVARSCVQMGWAGNAWAAADFWIRAEENWSRLCEQVPESRRLELCFEDLIERSEVELDRICRFLGVRFDPAMLEIEKDTTYRRPDPASCRSWRDDADPEEIVQIEERLGSRLRSSRYAPSAYPAVRTGALRRVKLRFGDRWGRIRFAVERYGFCLWLGGVISRRLPIAAFRRTVQSRINTIARRHLK